MKVTPSAANPFYGFFNDASLRRHLIHRFCQVIHWFFYRFIRRFYQSIRWSICHYFMLHPSVHLPFYQTVHQFTNQFSYCFFAKLSISSSACLTVGSSCAVLSGQWSPVHRVMPRDARGKTRLFLRLMFAGFASHLLAI